MNRDRLEAVMRMLLDSGDMTPMAQRQIRNVMDAEEERRFRCAYCMEFEADTEEEIEIHMRTCSQAEGINET